MRKKPTYEELEQRVKELGKEVVNYKLADEAMSKRTKQVDHYQMVLLELAKKDYSDLASALKKITKVDAETLGVERVSVWFFSEDRSEMVCENLFNLSRDFHEKGLRIKTEKYLSYFQALEEIRTVAAKDARTDPLTNEFIEEYLKPLGITSVMYVPVRIRGDFVGIVCHEHTGPMREWTLEEQDFAGSIAGMISLAVEASERKRIQETLRESEKKYRLLIDNYSAPITVCDRDGITLVINHAAAANFGGEPEDFIGKGLHEYLPNEADLIVERFRNVIESGTGADFEDMFELPPGKKWFWSNLQPVKDANGKTYAVLSISYEITERKRAEDALRKAHDELELRVEKRTAELVKANEKLQHEIEERKRLENALMQKEKVRTLGAIAAEVAHEIRNPLVSIGGFAKRLKQKSPDLHECDIILSESQRLEKILSRISNYLEPVEIHPRECSVNTIITNCVHLLSPETERKEVRCVLELAPRLPEAYVDPEILAQTFINLVRNATKAMDKGGILLVKTFESNQDIHIEFKNQVPGLKLKHPETLFMPFAEGGQGIGLPLCYRLLKDLGGLLSFTQEKDFIVFMVSIPKTVEPSPKKKEFKTG